MVEQGEVGVECVADTLHHGVIPKNSHNARWIVLAVLWTVLVSGGGTLLWKYARTAGSAAIPPEGWPAISAITREPNTATIVMLAHPRCPCTRASISELASLMNRVGQHARAHVLFVRPAHTETDWEKTALYQAAQRIPGVTVHSDVGGAEAALFKASTSGQTIVYNAGGQLIFRGGITAARGHEGDNIGRARIIELLTRGHTDRNDSKVFGCALEGGVAMKGRRGL